jgi:hypothetical protein
MISDMPEPGNAYPDNHTSPEASRSPLPPLTRELVETVDTRFITEPRSQWLLDMQTELSAFEDSGYSDLSVLNLDHDTFPPAASDEQDATKEIRPEDQLTMPDDSYIAYEDEVTRVAAFRRDLPHGQAEIMVASPVNKTLRRDPKDNKTLDPRFVGLGINGSDKVLYTLIAQSQGGKPWRHSKREQRPQPLDGQQMIAIRYVDKVRGSVKKRVPLGEREDITVTEFDMSEAEGELAMLDLLKLKRVDADLESREGLVNLITMELARQQGKLDLFGDVTVNSPAGQDGEKSLRLHGGAAAIAVMGLFRAIWAGEQLDPMARKLKGVGNVPGGRLWKDPQGWRKEQVSVADSAKSNPVLLAGELSKVMNDPDNASDQSYVHTFNRMDPAVREKRAVRAQEGLARDHGDRIGRVPHKMTDFLGHAKTYGAEKPVRWQDRHYQEVRAGRRARRSSY